MIFSLLLKSFESLKRHGNVNTAGWHISWASGLSVKPDVLKKNTWIFIKKHSIHFLLQTSNNVSISISIQSTQQSRDTLKSVFMYKTLRIVYMWDFVYFFSFMLSKSKNKISFFELRCHFKRFPENFKSEMEFILKQRLKTQIEYECINIK